MSTDTKVIYLDYNATTPIAPSVGEAMNPYLSKGWGNPSSSHSYGVEAKKAVDNARKQVANMLNCDEHEIIFTSGGSEANNYAIKGIAFEHQHIGNHVITSNFEHPAVTEALIYLERKGFKITFVPVDNQGIVDLQALKNAITPATILITIMHANNEIGTIQPIKEIVDIAKSWSHKIYVHSDASQSIGKIPVKVDQLGIDLLTVTPHKFYGPKGVGALYIKKGVKLEKLIHGAGHEFGFRAGTENVILEVGLGAAASLVTQHLDETARHMQQTRDALYNGLKQQIPNLKLNGHPILRLPNTLNVSFPIKSSDLLKNLDGKVAASAGAACHSDSVKISTVLKAIGLSEKDALGAVRFSTGTYLSMQDVDQAITLITEAVKCLTK